ETAAHTSTHSVSHNSSPQRCGGQSSSEGQRSNVIRCGWLRKQGGFVKTWHSRWFVLRGELLYYYKDEEETKPLGRSTCRLSINMPSACPHSSVETTYARSSRPRVLTGDREARTRTRALAFHLARAHKQRQPLTQQQK
uniref:PH domain-containing protein n=1 Tax=Poecilia latipinna TaxID=48699 RepID=A0A3B3V4I2_9TELE